MNDATYELLQKQGLFIQISGRDYVVRCLNPEHADSNPSMRIDKITGAFHCFACGFKGNIFKHFGVLTNTVPVRIAKLKEKLNALRTRQDLELPDGAVPYNRSFRGISSQTLKHFGAFYTNKEEKLVDRICFPIRDITERTVVFVARHTMSNGNPRYVNYPSGVSMPLFPASAPRDCKNIVLVEGLFDFLNLYDKGLTNAVCCFGTNTVQNNLKEKLLPFKAQGITKVYVMFDGDDAGRKAARELTPLLEQEGFATETINLPDNKDPGELDSSEVTSIKEYIH
jgi:DNA primase